MSTPSKVYGLHAVEATLKQRPRAVRVVLLQANRRDRRMTALLQLAENQGVSVQRVPKGVLDDSVDGRHQGAIAELTESEGAEVDGWDEARLLQAVEAAGQHALLLILDGVTDPHNLGACLRSADAAGVTAVIVPRDRSADLNPTVRKVACGAAESVPLVRVTNLARCLDALAERGVWLFGAAGEADQTLYDVELTGPVALLLGAEGSGLRRLTRERCDHLLKLPMAGAVSSLNVSVATGICLFEVVRQRRSLAIAPPQVSG